MEKINIRRLFVIPIILLSTLFVSCKADKQKKGKILNQVSGPITHFDPQKRTGLASSIQLGKVYETLLEIHPYDPPTTLLPNLAKELPHVSSDGFVYTFQLRQGVYYQENPCFQEPRELIADDFVNTFKRMADPKLVSPYYSYWAKHIVGMKEWHDKNKEKIDAGGETDYSMDFNGVQSIGRYGLKIKINAKNIDFIYLLASLVIVPIPKEAMQYYKNDFSEHMIGTGPFILKDYVRKSRITFVKNPKFRNKTFPKTSNAKYAEVVKKYGGQKLPLIDGIDVHIITESQTAWLNFMKGKIDYLEVPKDNFSEAFINAEKLTPEMVKKGIAAGQAPAQNNVYYYGFNLNHPIIKNKKVRHAMAMAVDQNRYNELFHNAAADTAHTILPPGILGNDPPLKSPYVGGKLEEAKKLLKEAGYANGKGIPELVILVKNKTISRQAGEFLKNEMSKIGIKVKVESVTWGALLSKIQKGQFTMFYLAWFTGVPSAFEFFELIYGKNYPDSFNRMGYQNAKFDKLLERAKGISNNKKRAKLIREMNEIFLEDLPFIPLVHTSDFFLRQGHLKNYIPTNTAGGLEQYFDLE